METKSINAAEFFAGIGLVRTALEPLGVNVVWANDIKQAKFEAYHANYPDAKDHFKVNVLAVRPSNRSSAAPWARIVSSTF